MILYLEGATAEQVGYLKSEGYGVKTLRDGGVYVELADDLCGGYEEDALWHWIGRQGLEACQVVLDGVKTLPGRWCDCDD